METHVQPHIIRFGEFELDPEAGELRRQGRPLKLQPQPLKLLILLATRPDRVVTREEIRKELWSDGTFVDFDQGVNFSIKQVRDALRDDAESPRFIQTVPRRGYRFIAPVETGPEKHGRGGSSATVMLRKAVWANIMELKLAEARQRRRQKLIIVLLAAVLVALVATLVIALTR